MGVKSLPEAPGPARFLLIVFDYAEGKKKKEKKNSKKSGIRFGHLTVDFDFLAHSSLENDIATIRYAVVLFFFSFLFSSSFEVLGSNSFFFFGFCALEFD